MSLFGSELSFVSLGCSCQTARQMQDNNALIAELVAPRHPPGEGGSYFDSLITPVETVIRFVENGIPPLTSATHLVDHVGPYWPENKLWFFHYFKNAEGQLDPRAGHQDQRKVAYLREKFHGLSTPTIFIISNTQNNLGLFHAMEAFVDMFGFTQQRILRLRRALEARFGGNFVGLVVIENERTAVASDSLPKVLRHRIALDHSEWKGSGGAWADAFRQTAGMLIPAAQGPSQPGTVIANRLAGCR